MTYYKKTDYKFVKFQKSSRNGKKYMAILQNKNTGRNVKVHFGAPSYQQYKDTTGLGLYSHKNHLDKERRRRYLARHKGFEKAGYYSPSYFSNNFLW